MRIRYKAVLGGFCLLLAAIAGAVDARGQGIQVEGRPVARVRLEGLEDVPAQLVRNQVRLEAGDPYDPEVVRRDIARMTQLGRFRSVRAEVTPTGDGSVVLTYVLEEQAVLNEVRVVGNSAIPDPRLLDRVGLRAGDPVSPFLIERGEHRIEAAYAEKGYFVADARINENLLKQQRILIYRIREGPKVRIRGIRFQGNEQYAARKLQAQITSRTYFPIFSPGSLSREQLELDAASLRQFYREHGYLEAQVGRRIDLSPDQHNAVVKFNIEEGPRYTVGRVRVEGADLFPAAQLRRWIPLRRGDIYSADQAEASGQAIERLYGRLGILDAKVTIRRLFHADEPVVDLLIQVEAGQPATVGQVDIIGNEITRQDVIRRQLRGLTPGRPFDAAGLEQTRRRLNESSLFKRVDLSILGDGSDRVRDAVVQVEEAQTGRVNIGAGVSSDLGVVGAFDIIQRNFDITNPPDSFQDLLTGDAFRGAGQSFALSLQPGDETSRYSISFREPYLFASDYFLDTNLYYYEQDRDFYEDRRVGGALGLGQRFGDIWSAQIRGRAARVHIGGIDADAPLSAFAVRGDSLLTGMGLVLTRDTTDSSLFPTSGSRWENSLEQVGALGGDYTFTTVNSTFHQFWTVNRDIFDRESVLSWRTQVGYIFQENEAPLFERFHAGGHRSFRGFEYRGIGPLGINADTGELSDEQVGGRWLLLTTLQYNFPLWKDTLRGVVFSDMGTIEQDIGVDQWRVSVGAGIRLKLPILGGAPLAIDFAWPVEKEPGDDTRIVSFDFALPLR